MRNIVIIQARMGSSRLPGKVLKKLGIHPVLDYVVSRVKLIDPIDHVIVATSQLPQDDRIEDWCRSHQVTCFRGSEDDVLSRYYLCAKEYNPDYVIRVTADCPFVDFQLANMIIAKMKENPCDVVLVEGELPRGLVVEIVSFPALEYMYNHGKEPRHREHVTYYAYEYPQLFTCTSLEAPKYLRFPDLRLTLDTDEDYRLCLAVAEHFESDKLIPSKQVVEFLLSRPDIASLNAHIEQKPVK